MKNTMNSENRISFFRQRTLRIVLGLVAILASSTLMLNSLQAQTYTVLYNFTGGADGGYVMSGLIQDSSGNLYGTASAGGNLTCSVINPGCGVVFMVNSAGQETVLYTFNGGTDGAMPQAGVIRDSHGNLYGTTARGGNPSCAWGNGTGCGTIFKIDPTGKETVLYRFTGGHDGAAPAAPLYRDPAGNLWGTTQFEGFAGTQCFGPGCGTLFRLDPKGKLSTYMFKGAPTDGSWPQAGVIADSVGNLYGTTLFGGFNNGGTIFKISTSGKISTVYAFNPSTGDATGPTGLLLSGGQLYGPGTAGGVNGTGAVFELGGAGEKVLYSFGITNGFNYAPLGPLVRDPSGNLYGIASLSGDFGFLYKLDSQGNFTDLHDFFGPPDGEMPMAGLIRDSAGNLYGTTETGGNPGPGTIFKYTP